MNTKKLASVADRGFYKGFQLFMGVGTKMMPWPKPGLLSGEGSAAQIPDALRKIGVTKPLIVCGSTMKKLAVEPICGYLNDSGISYEVFDEVFANPTDELADRIAKQYKAAGCDGFLAIGGGSPIDAAKGAAIRVARPNTPLAKTAGFFKALGATPPIIAVPTTSGSGSEISMVAIITEAATHHKVMIASPNLTPKFAILDPAFAAYMPKGVTATTGMDALTHAIEAYLSWASSTQQTARWCEVAVVKIFRYLRRAYDNGSDLEARAQMQEAAYLAGKAMTRVGLGYVHAIAHTLGGLYNTPHGLANSVILPIVLEDYGEAAWAKLAHLAELTSVRAEGTDREKALAFIAAIKDLRRALDLPTGFDFIQERDIPQIVKWAVAEGKQCYNPPVVYDEGRCRHVVNRIIVEA